MKRRTRYLLAVAATGIAVAAIFLWVELRPLPVTVAGVERDVPVRVFGLGTVEAQIVSKIGFEVGAALEELTADHGDRVKKGDVLARLYAADQRAKEAKAKAVLLSAEVDVRKAEANVQKARADLAQKQTANRRKQALVGRNIVSEQTAEEAKRDEDVAAAELAVAISEVDVAKARLAEARASLSYEKAVLDRHALLAPFDAVVVERHRELGTVVKAGDPIYTLLASETVWALAYIDESRAGPIHEGQAAEVRLRSLPQETFPARVVRIGIESDRVTEERRVWVKCDRCPPRIHLGEQAEIRITVAELAEARLVPEAAVAGFDGRTGLAWTVENGRLRRRSVSFRHRTEDARLEVSGGLPPGVEIVAEIVPGLREGRAARIVPSGAR
ncbi:MAG: efflux RND transporter periplasmic adaptor subunit [Alphaproteobacteria bacterium]|nr:efflux RND transporter periplasmic adaptor subunit [Alphaproteobacteria bacterium]